MQGTQQFEQIISAHLEICALRDDSFKKKLENPKKSLSKCVSYILTQVQRSGCNGFEDDEIYGMAMHYYDEKEIEVKDFKGSVEIKTNQPDPKKSTTSKESNPTLF